jgi:hypothetical protein
MVTVHEHQTVAAWNDALPVRSRVSWGAIFAGAAVAVALNILLNLLGAAIGLSIGPGEQVGTGVAIWAIIAALISLFVGGWVTSQCTVGETRTEAAFYGVILWAVLLAALVWLATMGLRMGLSAMVAAQPTTVTTYRPAPDAAAVQQTQPEESATAGAWWAFIGVLLSMAAAVGGTLTGAATRPLLRERRWHTEATAPR